MNPAAPTSTTADASGRGPLGRFRAWRDRHRAAMHHTHGWEIELSCPQCGVVAVPEFAGWTPSNFVRSGAQPTIYANLSCPRCRRDLRETAGEKLVELFEGVGPPPGNRHPYLLCFVLFAGPELAGIAAIALAWPGRPPLITGWLLRAPLLYLGPALVWLNGRVHAIRHRCACGTPAYKFMGMLGRSYCYRCSTCGRLIRLRD